MHAEEVQGKSLESSPQGAEAGRGGDPDRILRTSEIIASRTSEIERLLKRLHRVGPIDLPAGYINDAAVRSLVKLRAMEAVPQLCDEITFSPVAAGSLATPKYLPAAQALIVLGGSSIPGIYDSLEKTAKSDKEIKVFAFVLYAIDGGDQELTIFRLERQLKGRTEETERNTTFKENARKLLKCFATPDFFRFENNPFYGH